MSDAIAQLTSQEVVNGCFAGDQSLCQYVHRDANNQIARVDNLFINLANQRISGTDLELNYVAGLNNGSLGWRLFLTQLNENSIQNPGAPRDNRAGQINGGVGGFSLPEYKVTSNVTYSRGPFSLFLQGRWIDSGILDRTRIEERDYRRQHRRFGFLYRPQCELHDRGPARVADLLQRDESLRGGPALCAGYRRPHGHDRVQHRAPRVSGRRFAAGFRLSL